MAIDEKNTDKQINTDAFVRRMPSHRSQRPQRRVPQHAAAEEQTASNVAAEAEAFRADAAETVLPADEKAENALPVSVITPLQEESGDPADIPAVSEQTDEENSAEEAQKEAEKQPEAATEEKAVKSSNAALKFKSWIKNHKQLTAILATVLLLIIVLVVLFANGSTLQSRRNGNYMDQIRSQEIKINDVAAIDDFFINYYTALSSGNTTDLEAMFDDPSKANITTEISTIVSQYDNFQVYVTPGIEENDIVAFVSNDIHFDNIDATAPSVDSFYLKYDKEASALKISSDMYTDQNILKFMNLVSYREPIRTLLSDTNNRLSDALAGNKDLNNLYILMQSMTESAEMSQNAETVETEE